VYINSKLALAHFASYTKS